MERPGRPLRLRIRKDRWDDQGGAVWRATAAVARRGRADRCGGMVAILVLLWNITRTGKGTHTMFKSTGLAVALGAALLVSGCSVDPTPVAQTAERTPQASSKSPSKVKLTARAIDHRPDEFTTGGPYTCVDVKITNVTQEVVTAGVEYLTITGTDGTKRTPTMLVDTREMVTVPLDPGENARGVACAAGKFTPATVSYNSWTQQTRSQVER